MELALRVAVAICLCTARVWGFRPSQSFAAHAPTAPRTTRMSAAVAEEVDVVVIGSGLGGLCAAALSAAYGERVVCCESHMHAGGCAHAFERKGFTFDSGPSFLSGLSADKTPNPLKHVLNAIGEQVEWLTYDSWGVFMPEGDFSAGVGAKRFEEALRRFGGPDAQQQWDRLAAKLFPIAEATMGLPPFCLRRDPFVLLTLAPFAPALLKVMAVGPKIQGPFSDVLDEVEVTDPFVRNWLNFLCFALQGLPADGTLTAAMAYMFKDMYSEGALLDYPRGGTGEIIEALVRGLEKHGGKLILGAHVDEILVEDSKAVGVRLRNGREIRAKKKVVSNASIWDTIKLVPSGALPSDFRKSREAMPTCKSFMHLHLGVKIKAEDKKPQIHYSVIQDWSLPIDAPGNVVVISIPSVLDPSLAPPGCHVVHAYTAGNEPYEIWEGLDTKSDKYKALKAERAEVMMRAIEKIFPGLEERLEVKMIGTPLTHQRFLRRHRGTYGPEFVAGKESFPSPWTPLNGLVCVGDSVWPGIGVPAVAASGSLVANSIASPLKHWRMLKRIGF